MIGSTRNLTAYAYAEPTDMRKGFDGLSALVTGRGEDPLSGELYVFVSRDRRRAKVLMWDGTGLCVFAKRLETGRFASLWRRAEEPRLRLTMTELHLFLEGSELVGRVKLSPSPFLKKD